MTLAPLCDALYLVAPQDDATPINPGVIDALARKGAHLRGILHTQVAR